MPNYLYFSFRTYLIIFIIAYAPNQICQIFIKHSFKISFDFFQCHDNFFFAFLSCLSKFACVSCTFRIHFYNLMFGLFGCGCTYQNQYIRSIESLRFHRRKKNLNENEIRTQRKINCTNEKKIMMNSVLFLARMVNRSTFRFTCTIQNCQIVNTTKGISFAIINVAGHVKVLPYSIALSPSLCLSLCESMHVVAIKSRFVFK